MSRFAPAVRTQAKLKMALQGPAGGGKTRTAIGVMRALVGPTGKFAVLDSEHSRALKYALTEAEMATEGLDVSADGERFRFDHAAHDSHEPKAYIEAIKDAEEAGYDGLVIDSLTHMWVKTLEMVDKYADAAAKNGRAPDAFGSGWRKMTPEHAALVQAILAADLHIICTIRSKMEWERTQDDKGKTKIQKVGMRPVAREDIEYEFDIVAVCEDAGRRVTFTKNTCPALRSEEYLEYPGAPLAATLRAWLTEGVAPSPRRPANTPSEAEMAIVEAWRAGYAALREEIGAKPEAERVKAAEVAMRAYWNRLNADPATTTKTLGEGARAAVLDEYKKQWLEFGIKPYWDKTQQAAG